MNKFDMKTWYKQSQVDKSDFSHPDVRRLSGILEDIGFITRNALREMNEWLKNGENDIRPEEAKKRLHDYLSKLGIE